MRTTRTTNPRGRGRPAIRSFIAAVLGLALAASITGYGEGGEPTTPTAPATAYDNGLPRAHKIYAGTVSGSCVDAGLSLSYDELTGVLRGASFAAGERTPGTVKVEIADGPGSVSPEDKQTVGSGGVASFSIRGADRSTRVKFSHDAARTDLREQFRNVDCKPSDEAMKALNTYRDSQAERAGYSPDAVGCDRYSGASRKSYQPKLAVTAKARLKPDGIIITVTPAKNTRPIVRRIEIVSTSLANDEITPTGDTSFKTNHPWTFVATAKNYKEAITITALVKSDDDQVTCRVNDVQVGWPGNYKP